MKKVFGIFRGFPGLGRVSPGIALLKELKKNGHEVVAISYLQGLDALKEEKLPLLFDYCINEQDITSIGINPITMFATKIIEKILNDKPDVIIIDGEPLLQSTICDVYPKEKVISLLNYTDLYNESLPFSTIKFYHKNYLSGCNAIVHGIGLKIKQQKKDGCNINFFPTIIRDEIIKMKLENSNSKKIVGILGGGTVNSSKEFFKSTIMIGKKIINLANKMKEYQFYIYCNDSKIEEELLKNEKILNDNIKIISVYTKPTEIYKDTKLVIARAGRNVVSELLYLNIPGILIATDGDYRSKEQEKNIDVMVDISNNLFAKIKITDEEEKIISLITKKINSTLIGENFIPGNSYAVKLIEEM